MSDFQIDCELRYQVNMPSTFAFKIEAAHAPDQSITDECVTTIPPLPVLRHTDHLGTRSLRINVPSGPFSIRYLASASIERPAAHTGMREADVGDMPLEVLPFMTGSRYVESELIFQEAVNWIGATQRGYPRVNRICEWVRNNIKYEIGTSMPYGTTRDVLASRTGVCRDYAHVAIALCRALNIPARFVVGHVMWDTPPADFHALFEAWLDDRWVLFDPTQMAPTDQLIRIGSGHDAADLPFATIFGSAQLISMNPLVLPGLQEFRKAA